MEFINTQPEYREPQREEEQSIWEEKQFLEVLKHYSEDTLIPKKFKDRQWVVFGKSMVNTFMTEKDLPMVDAYTQILKINEMQRKPAHLLTFKEVHELDMMAFHMFLTARRAIGTQNGTVNERTLQNTQIAQNISTPMTPIKRGGFISRLGGGF